MAELRDGPRRRRSPDSSRGSSRSAAVAFEYAPHVGRPRTAVRPMRASQSIEPGCAGTPRRTTRPPSAVDRHEARVQRIGARGARCQDEIDPDRVLATNRAIADSTASTESSRRIRSRRSRSRGPRSSPGRWPRTAPEPIPRIDSLTTTPTFRGSNGATQTSGRRPRRRAAPPLPRGPLQRGAARPSRSPRGRPAPTIWPSKIGEDLERIDPVEPLQLGDADVDHPARQPQPGRPGSRRTPHHQPGSADGPRESDGGLVLVELAGLRDEDRQRFARVSRADRQKVTGRQPPALRPALGADRHVPGEDRPREPGRRTPARNDPLDLHAVFEGPGVRTSAPQPAQRSLDRPTRVDGGHRRPVLAIGVDVAGDLDAVSRVRAAAAETHRTRRSRPRRPRRHAPGTAWSPTPVSAMFALAMPAAVASEDHGRDTDDRIARRRLLQRHVRRPGVIARAGQPDLGQDLVVGEVRLERPLEEPVDRDDPLAARRPGDDLARRARAGTAGRSEAGSAWAIAPPTVPRLRTWTSPMLGSTSRSRP